MVVKNIHLIRGLIACAISPLFGAAYGCCSNAALLIAAANLDLLIFLFLLLKDFQTVFGRIRRSGLYPP